MYWNSETKLKNNKKNSKRDRNQWKKKHNHDQRSFKKNQIFFEICKTVKIKNFVFDFEIFFENIFDVDFETEFNFFNVVKKSRTKLFETIINERAFQISVIQFDQKINVFINNNFNDSIKIFLFIIQFSLRIFIFFMLRVVQKNHIFFYFKFHDNRRKIFYFVFAFVASYRLFLSYFRFFFSIVVRAWLTNHWCFEFFFRAEFFK